jgi:hypothetical protein
MNRRQEFQSIKTHEFVFQDASGNFPVIGGVMAVATEKGIAQFTRDLSLNSLYVSTARIDNIQVGATSANFVNLTASGASFGSLSVDSSATFLGEIIYNNEVLAGNVGGSENCMVAVGPGPNSIRTSINGEYWLNATGDIFAVQGNGVAWNGSIWVAVGQSAIGVDPDTNTIAYSANGMNWTFATGGFGAAGYGVAWNGTIWVAVGTDRTTKGTAGANDKTILVSNDGKTWNPVMTQFLFGTGPIDGQIGYGSSVAWNGSVWVAGGYDYLISGDPVNIVTSKDGYTWQRATFQSGAHTISPGCNTVAWGDTQWIVGGNDSAYGQDAKSLMYGSDQSNNTVIFDHTTNTAIATSVIHSVAWNGVMWILASNDGVYTASSTNPTTPWNLITTIGGSWKGVVWNGSLWTIVGAGGIYTSYDGVRWSPAKGASSGPLNGISARKILPNTGYILPKMIPASRNFFNASGMNIVTIQDNSVKDYSVILLTIRNAKSGPSQPLHLPEGMSGKPFNQGRAYVYSKQSGVGFTVTSYPYDYSTYDYAILN